MKHFTAGCTTCLAGKEIKPCDLFKKMLSSHALNYKKQKDPSFEVQEQVPARRTLLQLSIEHTFALKCKMGNNSSVVRDEMKYKMCF